MKLHLKTFFTLIVLSIVCEVQAETKSEANTQTLEPASQSTKEYRAYFTANGFVNGSFITEPKSKTLPNNGQLLVLPYPGFGGVGGGGGLNIGIAWKALSLDIGLDWSVDQGEGRINGQTFSLSQTTRHIPLTMRVEIPNWAVRPSLIGGIDWVSSTDTKLETPIGFISSPALLDPESQDYTAWIFGFGLDFMLNDTLRIPFRILAVYAPLDRSDLSERIELESNGFRFNSQWEWQPRISLGLSYDFKSF